MSEENAMPVFVQIGSTSHDAEAGTVSAMMLVDAENGANLVFDNSCIPALIGALSIEFQMLQKELPEEERDLTTTLRCTGLTVAEGDPGSVILLIDLANGVTLPLELPSQMVNPIAADLYAFSAPRPQERN